MAPTSKENEVLIATPEVPAPVSAPGAFRPDETSSRPSPVALEVPVTVNGARTVEGSDKREPFSETTKTVLVFGNGAVIRLSSPVSAGQLLFLTNEKTKKEVVCQVVKSKNYRSVSGYVELEFTESVVGFWGMRFPTDRIAVQAPATETLPPAAKGNPGAQVTTAQVPVVPKVSAPAPVVSTAPKAPEVKALPIPVAPKPAAPSPAAEMKLVAPIAQVPPVVPAVQSPTAAPIAKAPEPPAPSHNLASTLASSVANLLGSPEVPPAAASPKAPAPVAVGSSSATTTGMPGETSTEELKQQAARLQEQLSSMLFSSSSTAKHTAPEVPAPTHEAQAVPRVTTKVLEMAKSSTAPVVPALGAKPVPPAIKSSFDTEEVKIPSWLEPLARNAAAPASTQELIEREKARHAAELAANEEAKPEPIAVTDAPKASEAEVPAIGGLPPLEEELGIITHPQSSGGSKRGMWIGISAAIVLAAAGGAWYVMRPTGAVQGTGAPVTRTASPLTSSAAPTIDQPANQPATQPVPRNAVASAAEPISTPSPAQTVANPPATRPTVNSQPIPVTRDNSRGSGTTIPAASTERISRPAPASPAATPATPAPSEPKKSSIGDVRLASPTVNRAATSKEDAVAAPALSSADSDAGANLGAGLLDSAKQPAAPTAPLPVGGDVKPAKLLLSVPPTYPSLAKSQHISGDVSVDALIDANGKVTTMKVVSGPQLLRQAAMDALRQWKYQPASLDGNAVPMHLTVTLQFRMQ